MKKIIWFTNPDTSTARVVIDGEITELFDSTHREDDGEKYARLIDCNSPPDYEKVRKLMNRINTDNSTSQQT